MYLGTAMCSLLPASGPLTWPRYIWQDDMAQRQLAIQKLVAVRQYAHLDGEPCKLLDGLYVGEHPWKALMFLVIDA